jgi:hypothetical protein
MMKQARPARDPLCRDCGFGRRTRYAHDGSRTMNESTGSSGDDRVAADPPHAVLRRHRGAAGDGGHHPRLARRRPLQRSPGPLRAGAQPPLGHARLRRPGRAGGRRGPCARRRPGAAAGHGGPRPGQAAGRPRALGRDRAAGRGDRARRAGAGARGPDRAELPRRGGAAGAEGAARPAPRDGGVRGGACCPPGRPALDHAATPQRHRRPAWLRQARDQGVHARHGDGRHLDGQRRAAAAGRRHP